MWPDLVTQMRPEPDLLRTCFWITDHTPDETNGVNNAVSCYKEAVQFLAPLVTSLFASF